MKKSVLCAAALLSAVAVILAVGCAGDKTKKKTAAPETADINIDMVFVEGGTFTMGCTEEQDGDCEENEIPAHSVTVSGFYIGKYEVTQAQWKAVMGGGHDVKNEGDSLPVDNVSWNDAQAFIMKLNAKTGKTYRLPTEAEWEFAARGGKKSKGYKYAGSNNIDDVAWHKGNSGGVTHPVGLKAPNELGIYDMTGNLFENVIDWHAFYSASAAAETNPTGGPEVGESKKNLSVGGLRVSKGGSWREDAASNRIPTRFGDWPQGRDDNSGFRLVLSPETEADTGGVWRTFEMDGATGYRDRYERVRIKPDPNRRYTCNEFDNVIGVVELIGEERNNYYLTRSGRIFGRDSLFTGDNCETEGFIRFKDSKTGNVGMFNRDGKVAVPAEYKSLKYTNMGKVINGVIMVPVGEKKVCEKRERDKDEEDEDDEYSYANKLIDTMNNKKDKDEDDEYCYNVIANILIDTLNNVLIEDFPSAFGLTLDLFSMEKSEAPHPDTVRASFPAKGGGYYSFIDIEKEFKRWLADSLEASLKADMLNESLTVNPEIIHIRCYCETDPNKYLGWHITNYWAHAISDSYGRVGRRNFIVRNYDNLIREARKYDHLSIDTDIYRKYSGNSGKFVFPDVSITGSDMDNSRSHYEYKRTGNGGYRLSYVTLRTAALILDTKIYRVFGDSYLKNESYEEAAEYYEKAIESDPDCAAEYYDMKESGKEKRATLKWEKASGEAAKYFRDIIKPATAHCAASFYGLGESYIERGNKSKGRAFKNKADELGYDPE